MIKSSLKILLSIIIVICSFLAFTGSSEDYEYTNIISDLNSSNSDSEPDEQLPDAANAHSNEEEIKELKNSESTASEKPVEFSNYNIVDSYNYMKSKNPDTVGWLYIPNIGSYPVMYNSTDNQYYLSRNSNKIAAKEGSIFMNVNSGGTFDNICLIHGHQMKSGKMFGSLKKYKDQNFFQNNDFIEVFDGECLRFYKPFSSFYYEDGKEFIEQNIDNQQTKDDYFKKIQSRNLVKGSDELTPDFSSDIMVLSTCDYAFENCRLGVACYTVKLIPYVAE